MASRGGAALFAILGVLALAGCSLSPGSSLSPSEAREAFYSVLDDTQRQLGGVWENSDDPTARGCVLPLWVEGLRYPGLRLGPVPSDASDALAAVTVLWRDLGLTVRESDVGDATELAGTSEFGQLVQFRVSPIGMTLQGESECRPA